MLTPSHDSTVHPLVMDARLAGPCPATDVCLAFQGQPVLSSDATAISCFKQIVPIRGVVWRDLVTTSRHPPRRLERRRIIFAVTPIPTYHTTHPTGDHQPPPSRGEPPALRFVLSRRPKRTSLAVPTRYLHRHKQYFHNRHLSHPAMHCTAMQTHLQSDHNTAVATAAGEIRCCRSGPFPNPPRIPPSRGPITTTLNPSQDHSHPHPRTLLPASGRSAPHPRKQAKAAKGQLVPSHRYPHRTLTEPTQNRFKTNHDDAGRRRQRARQ
jgi:hypothetical protein